MRRRKVSITLDGDLHDSMLARFKYDGTTVSQQINLIVREYYESVDKQ